MGRKAPGWGWRCPAGVKELEEAKVHKVIGNANGVSIRIPVRLLLTLAGATNACCANFRRLWLGEVRYPKGLAKGSPRDSKEVPLVHGVIDLYWAEAAVVRIWKEGDMWLAPRARLAYQGVRVLARDLLGVARMGS